MYYYFKGVLTEKLENAIVIECNGVGYELQIGPVLASKVGSIGSEVKVYSHFYIGQDRQELFAFPDMDYKRLFELLITVNGIGPKAALAVLEAFTPEAFAVHVMNNDSKALTAAKGIGKKSAERIIFDLQDKVKKTGWMEERELEAQTEVSSIDELGNKDKLDIIEGLIFLGYQNHEAKQLVNKTFDSNLSVEENLKNAMQSVKKF